MKLTNKQIAIFGIASYIIGVAASMEDSSGNYVAPIFLILSAAILTIIFSTYAVIRLWSTNKFAIATYLVTTIFGVILLMPLVQVVHLISFITIISILWTSKYGQENTNAQSSVNISIRTIGTTAGMIMYAVSGLLMFVFWIMAMSNWLGLLGIILAFFLAPGLVIFPIIFWIVEGVFPLLYFSIWAIGIIGIFIAGMSARD